MDNVTRTIVECIDSTDVMHRHDILDMARLAFLDYIASLAAAENHPKVASLAAYVQSSGATEENRAEDRALYYGFASHFLDLDDAQANLAGHFSTVLYSALLAVLVPTDTWYDVFRAYAIGAELEGIIGALINPAHRSQGFHSTGTVGVIGAAAAIGALRGVHGESLAQLLSLAATQSSGMSFQSGTDGKPLHSGLAARNAVWAYELLQHTELATSIAPFHSDNGWFQTIANVRVSPEDIRNRWLQPGQIIQPGLWMKIHPYCSAAICGAEAAELVYKRRSSINLWPSIESVIVHFPPNADKALRYKNPITGREGQFSIEYIIWQLFTYGEIRDDLFTLDKVPLEATEYMRKIIRKNDFPVVPQDVRITAVEVTFTDGRKEYVSVDSPKGSPQNPLTIDDIRHKLLLSVRPERVDAVMRAFTDEDIHQFIQILKGEGVLHV